MIFNYEIDGKHYNNIGNILSLIKKITEDNKNNNNLQLMMVLETRQYG